LRSLEAYILDIIEGRRRSLFIQGLLRFLSFFYHAGIALRHTLYDGKWMKISRVPIPVISIGNIAAGGTGKTPLVHFLAKELLTSHSVAILSRGYRGSSEKSNQRVNSPAVGDEPYWLATALPEAQVWVGRDRAASALLACEHGAERILLDDGMQHRRLARDVEIVVMDAEDLFGKGDFLPRGYLRDTPKRLAQADLIAVSHIQNESHLEEVRARIAPYSKAPLVGMRMRISDDLKGKKVGVFCGIAKPERFLSMVRELGAEIVSQLITLDHVAPTKEQLEAFAAQFSGAEMLVCTEKDAVKLPSDLQTCIPIRVLKAELEMTAGHEHWKQLIQKIRGTDERRN
jgi:tetraacyldisaccharide 4'-kinase